MFSRISRKGVETLKLRTFSRVFSQLSKNAVFQPKQSGHESINFNASITNANLFRRGEGLKIHWKHGQTSEFHSAWLRYNCPNNRDPTSGDRSFMTACDVDVDVKIKNVYYTPTPNLIRVVFENGETCEFDCSWLWRNSSTFEQSVKSSTAETPEWKQENPKLKDLDAICTLSDLLDSEESKWEVLSAINKYGFALIRAESNGCTVSDVGRAALRIGGRIHETNFPKFFDVISKVQFPMNAAYTSVELEAHMDQQNWEAPPGLQFLHCLANDEEAISGGESTLVDLFAVANRMWYEFPQEFDTLRKVPVPFERKNEVSHYRYTTPHISVDPRDMTITGVRWYPFSEAPVVSLPTVQEIREYYDAYSIFAEMANSQRHSMDFRMNEGDMLIFNNRRMGHGRKAFEQTGTKERHLRGTYVNIDDFASEFRVMAEQKAQETGGIFPLYPVGNNSM